MRRIRQNLIRLLLPLLAAAVLAAPVGGISMAEAKTAEGASALVREAAGEGAVLLKNEGGTLPLQSGARVSVFGRTQIDTYKSGTGSGGMVHAEYLVNILEGLREHPDIKVNENLAGVYEDWVQAHPFDDGGGVWANQPWSQEEMPLTGTLCREAAETSDAAVAVIGRTAGEESDNRDAPGSFRLSAGEEAMLQEITAAFQTVIVVLNISNIMDLGWLEQFGVDAALCIWQGGQETGRAAAGLLSGDISPSGRLADTVADAYQDYPSAANFGGAEQNVYQEDIYVGYRYFETFRPEKVRYPFGYGLSYTSFEQEVVSAQEREGEIRLEVRVTNTGGRPGKEVVQAYFGAPQGNLGKPVRQLAAFQKTQLLLPGESELAELRFPVRTMASYDDGGLTGYPSSWVLEAGEYTIYLGSNVRDCEAVYTYHQPSIQAVEGLSQAMAPSEPFQRMKPKEEGGKFTLEWENTPIGTVDLQTRISENLPPELPQTGYRGIQLRDVAEGRAELDEFIAQLADEDLACLVRGEGMNSPKVTAGTAAAFGGVTDRLKALGIPVACATDGPSGIRLDSGETATSLPIGTLLACTWNPELVTELYAAVGQEMQENRVDVLLAPGLNIHRDPLCGRNFEYFSEDPYLSGIMAAAELRGLNEGGAMGTVKHLAANNQEKNRNTVNSAVSERALRELYLKPGQIALSSGADCLVMSSYNPVNGVWSSSNYDLNTTILRNEWGYDGAVMTDWWAYTCDIGSRAPSQNNTRAMLRAQNDLYMVVDDSAANSRGDNTLASLRDGSLTRGELQRSAANICRSLMKTAAFAELEPEPEAAVYGAGPQSDDFDGGALNREIWRVEGEDSEHYWVRDSRLTIRTQQGDFWEGHNDLKNQMVQSAFGDWGVTVKAGLSQKPSEEYQAVGIAAKQDDDNYLFLKYEYNSPLTVALVQERGGRQETLAALSEEEMADFDRAVYLRMVKRGERYTFYASPDGDRFYTVGTASASYPSPKLCLIASSGSKPAGAIEAGFDYVWVDRYGQEDGGDGFIRGYGDGAFRPDGEISRAETASLFARISDGQRENLIYPCPFPDVPPGAWYRDGLGYCVQAGLIGGGEDGLFRPEQSITRAEFAAVAARFAGLPGADGVFPDCAGHWAEASIGALAGAGILSGYEDGTFRPEQPVTRAEAVKAADLLLGRTASAEPAPFSDLDGHWAAPWIAAAA